MHQLGACVSMFGRWFLIYVLRHYERGLKLKTGSCHIKAANNFNKAESFTNEIGSSGGGKSIKFSEKTATKNAETQLRKYN